MLEYVAIAISIVALSVSILTLIKSKQTVGRLNTIETIVSHILRSTPPTVPEQHKTRRTMWTPKEGG